MYKRQDLQSQPLSVYEDAAPQYASASVASGNLDDLLAHLDAGFSETLLKLIAVSYTHLKIFRGIIKQSPGASCNAGGPVFPC